jgi:hypothetical protein
MLQILHITQQRAPVIEAVAAEDIVPGARTRGILERASMIHTSKLKILNGRRVC